MTPNVFILKELPAFIIGSLRKQDMTGRFFGEYDESFYLTSRWGGEGFLILLPQTDQLGAGVVAEKLRNRIQNHLFRFENKKIQVTLSFGVCEFRRDEDINKCIGRADSKLYETKQMGRNRGKV